MLQNVHSICTWNLKIIFIALFTTAFLFFYFSKKSYKNVCSGRNKKKKKKKKTHTHTQTPTKFFERAIVQLANSNLDFDISFNQIQ